MNLEQKIEAILFFKGEPISRKRLAEILAVGQMEINEGIEKLKENLQNRGIALIEKDNEITLGTAPELSKLIEDLQKEELNKDLSKASLEISLRNVAFGITSNFKYSSISRIAVNIIQS